MAYFWKTLWLHALVLVFVCHFSELAFAQFKPGQGSENICANKDQSTIDAVLGTFEKAAKPGSKMTSVDAVLANLPLKMRREFILMTESRSLQAQPRVLLKSPNSEIVVSFNTTPGSRGYNNLEVRYWNGKTKKFNYVDVKFAADEKSSPVISQNPRACVRCHYGVLRPNWDPYNFWHGQTPFNRDSLVKGSEESRIYRNFLTKVKSGADRLRQLRPFNRIEDIDKEWEKIESAASIPSDPNSPPLIKLPSVPMVGIQGIGNTTSNEVVMDFRNLNGFAKKPGMQLASMDRSDGPGVRLFDQLTPLNFCRISEELANDENADIFKYAAWMSQECEAEAWRDAIPNWARAKMDQYFQIRGLEPVEGERDTFDTVKADTKMRQKRVFEEKVERQRAFFERQTGGKTAAELELKKREVQDRETSLNSIAPLRYMLEPFGVNVRHWSMSLDPETYTFADLFATIRSTPFFRGVRAELQGERKGQAELNLENSKGPPIALTLPKATNDVTVSKKSPLCDLAKDKSLTAFERLRPKFENRSMEAGHCFDCDVKAAAGESEAVKMIENTNQAVIKESAHKLFKKHGCVSCHKEKNDVGATEIPFGDPDKFAKFVQSYTGSMSGWDKMVWRRITMDPNDFSSMPQGGPPIKDPQELATIRAYMINLKNGK